MKKKKKKKNKNKNKKNKKKKKKKPKAQSPELCEKSRWPSWAPRLIILIVSVDVQQH